MKVVRQVAALLLCGGGIWLLLALFVQSPNSQAEVTSFSTSRECATCHGREFEEWSASEHSNAWTGTAVREMSNDFSNQDCIDCHAPMPVLQTGIGKRVLPRLLRRVEGVDCIACHDAGNGRMAGSFSDAKPACQPLETLDLVRPEFCGSCHNQHQTVEQWRGSKAASVGETCISCHMPFRDGDPAQGRDHGMHGGNRLDLLQKAVELRGNWDAAAGGFVLELANVGAGHSFPTDERSRSADLFWRRLGSADEAPWHHLHRLRSPYRHETDLPDTLLKADEVRRIALLDRGPEAEAKLLLNDAPGTPIDYAIEVALFYKRSPYYYDGLDRPAAHADAALVKRIELRRP